MFLNQINSMRLPIVFRQPHKQGCALSPSRVCRCGPRRDARRHGLLNARETSGEPWRRCISKRRGRVLLTEIGLPRIARRGTACLISIRGKTRTTRIDKFELDEGFQPYHPPFRVASLHLGRIPGRSTKTRCNNLRRN